VAPAVQAGGYGRHHHVGVGPYVGSGAGPHVQGGTGPYVRGGAGRYVQGGAGLDVRDAEDNEDRNKLVSLYAVNSYPISYGDQD